MEENNKRIVKNTLYLYVRMAVMMALSVFSTRIVLHQLGVSDYGLYNVVGGFVSMFTVLNSILQTGTRRFLALNIGKDNAPLLKRTFSTAFVIHCVVALAVVLLLESFGLWFLNTRLNVEPGRLGVANYVFQFAVASVFLSITQTPYTAAVTAHEKFDIYAYLSIFDVVAKVAVLFLLVFFPYDKLIVYAILLFGVNLLNILIYRVYCIRQFAECGFSLAIDRRQLKEMTSFSFWSLLGHVGNVLNAHGTTLLLNIFFNTVVNAARGIAASVGWIIESFVQGFVTAAVPQLTKYYGEGDMERFKKLIFNVSQYTVFLLSIIAVPAMMELDFVLQLWLGTVPEHTSIFVKITIITLLLRYANIMVDHGLTAIGRVKEISLIITPVYMLNFPLVYLVLELGGPPWAAYAISLLPAFAGFVVTLLLLKKHAGFPAGEYFQKVFLKNFGLIVLSALIPLYLRWVMPDGVLRFFVVCSVSVVVTVAVLFFAGLNKDVQQMVKDKLQKICKRHA